MPVILSLLDATLAFGTHPLLDGAAFSMEDGERIGLIGRNGTGKSSLLTVIARSAALDDGRLVTRDGLSIAVVEQEPVLPPADSLHDSLMLRGGIHDLLEQDERLGWQRVSALAAWLERFGLDGGLPPDRLSGGQSKRAALALAFALAPELLLLDEPTNHLDIDAIEALEGFVRNGPASIVITHDRRFLDNVVTRVLELDRGVLRSYPGNYAAYESQRSDELQAENRARRRFEKFWAQEEIWIRKGVEARRTRNEGRVRRLEALREERRQRRDRVGALNLQIDSGARSGKLVAELEDVSVSFGERTVIRNLNFKLSRGDRVGLIGANGSGKTTLIRTLLGEQAPVQGSVRLGTHLQIAYFDQMREALDPDMTVADAISPGSEYVEIDGQRRHLASYLGDFLFSPSQMFTPVRTLSGGERNRLMLARLFARPANLLVLDEPTNDLDLQSVELLETMLQGYPGTVVLVSHDRSFLDNIVTSVLVAQHGGQWLELVGGYSDWVGYRDSTDDRGSSHASPGSVTPAGSVTFAASGLAHRKASSAGQSASSGNATTVGEAAVADTVASEAGTASAGRTASARRAPPAEAHTSNTPPNRTPSTRTPLTGRKLSNREKRELDALPAEIESLEAEQQLINAAMADPAYFRGDADRFRSDRDRLAAIETQVADRMERWDELMQLQEAASGPATRT